MRELLMTALSLIPCTVVKGNGDSGNEIDEGQQIQEQIQNELSKSHMTKRFGLIYWSVFFFLLIT